MPVCQMTEISAFAAPTNPATATALAKTMQQISKALSFILSLTRLLRLG